MRLFVFYDLQLTISFEGIKDCQLRRNSLNHYRSEYSKLMSLAGLCLMWVHLPLRRSRRERKVSYGSWKKEARGCFSPFNAIDEGSRRKLIAHFHCWTAQVITAGVKSETQTNTFVAVYVLEQMKQAASFKIHWTQLSHVGNEGAGLKIHHYVIEWHVSIRWSSVGREFQNSK